MEEQNLSGNNRISEKEVSSENEEEVRQTQIISDRHSTFSEAKIPKSGMEFDSEEEAYQFYKAYSRECGFGIRRDHLHRDRNGNILDRTFVCACEGERAPDKRDVNTKAPRPETRTNCCARMKVTARHTGKFSVYDFNPNHHGHELVSPHMVHLLRCHRTIDSRQAAQLDNIEKAGITPKAGLDLVSEQVGGRENVGYTIEDVRNYLRTKRSDQTKQGDAGVVLGYLQSRKSADPNFYSDFQLDPDDLITNIFWTDGQMIADYACFGDVMCFDTTYRKHKDGRPFAFFAGVNHHKQTTIFGAALLYDETAETFSWLFDTFVKAMGGKLPATILTDQDAAMAKALRDSEIWRENTRHRLCIWHIYQNAAIHLSSVFKNFTSFADDFSSCVYDFDEEEDFIDAWVKMLKKYKLEDNEWLQTLFEKKEQWALVYGRRTFCAEMTTTQRSESMHSSLKKYVNYKQNLSQFFHHLGKLVDHRRYEEKKADYRASHSTPKLTLSIGILRHAASVYTHNVYKQFQDQVARAIDANMEGIGQVGSQYQYTVTPYRKHYKHTVTYEASDCKISCSCKKFEFAGILCSHALKVLMMHNIKKIPERYILKRWTKEAKKGVVESCMESQVAVNSNSKNKDEHEKIRIGERYEELCRLDNLRTTRAALSEETFEFARNNCRKEIEEIDVMLEKLALPKSTHVPHYSASVKKFVPEVTEKQIVTSQVESDVFDSSNIVETEAMTSENTSNERIVQGWKKKPSSRVKSGKRLKSALEQATQKKRKGKEPSNKASVDKPSNNDSHDTNIHDSNPSKPIGLQPPSFPPLPYVSQLTQVHSFNANWGNLNANTLVQPPPCPTLPSLSQFSQNYHDGIPEWRSSTTPLNTTYPTIPTSQLMALIRPNVHHNVNYLPQYVQRDQSNNTSMMKLLQAQMQQPRESGNFYWKDSTPKKQ